MSNAREMLYMAAAYVRDGLATGELPRGFGEVHRPTMERLAQWLAEEDRLPGNPLYRLAEAAVAESHRKTAP